MPPPPHGHTFACRYIVLAASLAAGATLPEAVRLANAAGALSTTVNGAAASAPDRSAALALLDSFDQLPGRTAPGVRL